MGAGRAEQLLQGEFPARLGNCIPCPCQNWDKPRTFYAPCRGMDSPQVARTLLGFSCPWHVLAPPLWRLGEDKRRSVSDAVCGNLLTQTRSRTGGCWRGLDEQAVPQLWVGRGAGCLQDLSPFVCPVFREPQRESSARCRAVGSGAGTGKVLMRTLAAFVGVGVGWWEALTRQRRVCSVSHSPGRRELTGLQVG